MKNEGVEKAVKNRAEFGNRFLSKQKSQSIRCMPCIQAMCIQMMYQISVYAFKANLKAINDIAQEKKGERWIRCIGF